MKRLRFSIDIDAPRTAVWDAMLGDDTYRVWTAEFMPGSHYVGDWSEGSKILFLAPGQNGPSGMVSRILTHRPYEHISIEHLGVVRDGQEHTSGDAVEGWAGALESYNLRESDGTTELLVEMDSDDANQAMFEDAWPRALRRLKELVEREAG